MYSYEEIYDIIVDILVKREQVMHEPNQWEGLKIGVAEVISRRAGQPTAGYSGQTLTGLEAELARDVFWDLFRQGFITLGYNNSNPSWPWFRLSYFGQQTLGQDKPYRFTDSRSYMILIKGEIGEFDDITSMYLDESVRAFYSGCYLASCVMLGVAREDCFLRILQTTCASKLHGNLFQIVQQERTLLQKILKYRNVLANMGKSIPADIREDLNIRFDAIQSLIRVARNETGHPSGKQMQREEIYILLQMFIPYARKLRQLESFFRAN
jgi:hypothetical protein